MLNKKTCVPCKGGIPPLTAKEIAPFLKELSVGWTLIEKKQIEKSYTFPTYLEGIAFCNKVAELSEAEGHHPYIHINYKEVKIILFTHKINGLHENDFIVASKCDLLL
mgnify:FL=1